MGVPMNTDPKLFEHVVKYLQKDFDRLLQAAIDWITLKYLDRMVGVTGMWDNQALDFGDPPKLRYRLVLERKTTRQTDYITYEIALKT